MKKAQKHEVNLQKNSTLYFQIGVIICLLSTFGLLEMKVETKGVVESPPLEMETPLYVDIPIIKEKRPVIEKPKPVEIIKHPQNFKQVIDDVPEDFFKETLVEPKITTPALNPDALPDFGDKPSEPEDVPFILIQNAPIYPGCESAKDNKARKKCMSDKINKLIRKKFDGSEIASKYGLTGKQKISVQFKINKYGNVEDIITRSPHPKLDEEAERVINFIPQMIPGSQRDKNVGVIYHLPIVFEVQ
ncbi:energy transducer TonB [Tamlana fucoidanivorans]|uniref:energy transducer TonB n=1 Tax=Allotamlana fucoidanivorans TaxID=2583814 RepID=UPI0013053A72|nr:energy transducer TonB [Tamlana fucoidanivorans]